MNEDVAGKNSMFFTIVNQYSNNDNKELIHILKEMILKENDNFIEKGYWYEFGYKYLGIYVKRIEKGNYYEALEYPKCDNKAFIKKLLDLAFEPKDNVDNSVESKKRYEIRNQIIDGITNFIDYYNYNMDMKFGELCNEIAYSGIEYLSNHLSKYDEIYISGAKFLRVFNNNSYYLPITPRDKFRFGIVYPWPGSESAESELLIRFRRAAQDVGFECVFLSDFGKVLDENQVETDKLVDPKELDFVLTTHYESNKTVDAYYYHLLWNPPEIPLNVTYYEDKVVNNYLMNDDYLIYDFGGMSNHLRSILLSKPRTLDNASTLVGSFPQSIILEPKLEDPKLFYCGMNWEKVVHNSNRHEGLFKLLDNTNCVKFYGPEEVKSWGGLRPWEGYKCYQYSIPFDGFSILKEINKCGICLAISSDIHRRAGAVTNRAYEACAAGAVIISDNNVFMEEHFKDAVLFIRYNKNDPEDTFRQIMEKYQWIKDNPEKALKMAKRAQQIFLEKFSMDQQLIKVFQNHYDRFRTIEKDLFALDNNKRVLVTAIVNSLDLNEAITTIDHVSKNVNNQYYCNITIGLICDVTIQNKLTDLISKKASNIELIALELFDDKGARSMTDGQAIRIAQKSIVHDFYTHIAYNEIWYYDHITTLIRALEDEEDAICSYAGRLSMDKKGYRRADFFGTLQVSTVYYQEHPDNLPIPGQFLFRKEAHSYMPDFLFDCLDGYEHAAYVNLLWFKYNKKLVFSKRLTCIYYYDKKFECCSVIDSDRQIRFIRGLVKYDLPITGGAEGKINNHQLKESLAFFPIRSWITMRYYKIRLRHTDTKTKKGKLMLQKYQDAFEGYRNKFF